VNAGINDPQGAAGRAGGTRQSARPLAVTTPDAPGPVGSYSQAVEAHGFIYISGQTPRYSTGERALTASFQEQTELVMRNMETIARAAGSSLRETVHMTVYLRDMAKSPDFDQIYARWIGDPWPARVVIPCDLTVGELEVSAVLFRADRELLLGSPCTCAQTIQDQRGIFLCELRQRHLAVFAEPSCRDECRVPDEAVHEPRL
jgi:2-iminobutanoate/2-iminopropanoate deaminase